MGCGTSSLISRMKAYTAVHRFRYSDRCPSVHSLAVHSSTQVLRRAERSRAPKTAPAICSLQGCGQMGAEGALRAARATVCGYARLRLMLVYGSNHRSASAPEVEPCVYAGPVAGIL